MALCLGLGFGCNFALPRLLQHMPRCSSPKDFPPPPLADDPAVPVIARRLSECLVSALCLGTSEPAQVKGPLPLHHFPQSIWKAAVWFFPRAHKELALGVGLQGRTRVCVPVGKPRFPWRTCFLSGLPTDDQSYPGFQCLCDLHPSVLHLPSQGNSLLPMHVGGVGFTGPAYCSLTFFWGMPRVRVLTDGIIGEQRCPVIRNSDREPSSSLLEPSTVLPP